MRDVQQDVTKLRVECSSRGVGVRHRVANPDIGVAEQFLEVAMVRTRQPLAFLDGQFRPDVVGGCALLDAPQPDMFCSEHVGKQVDGLAWRFAQ